MTSGSNPPLYAVIEAGGTKFIVGLAAGPDQIVETGRIETTDPANTIGAVVDWLQAAIRRHGPVHAAGIASFGPLELDRSAPNWGHITTTPKPGWANADLAGAIARQLGVPVAIDTDVNGAGLAEARWGAGQGQNSLVYITIGTGIGGGAIVDGRPLHGLSHPEMGHVRVKRHEADGDFAGICPFHGDCLEGLASGPAIIARWGCSLSDLPVDAIGHDIIAYYLAQLVVNLQAMMEPGRIILGGGVMATAGMLDRVRKAATALGAGYFRGKAETIVVAPALGDRSGLLGALTLAMNAV